jgi:hypothetical protein
MPKRLIVEEQTGEITNELDEGDRILRAKSIEKLRTTAKWDIGPFSKVNSEELNLLAPTLTASESCVILKLLPLVSYTSCLIQYPNGRDINFDSIVKRCGLCHKTTVSTVESLIAKDILYKGRNSKGNQYFMNPWIAYRGNTINKVLFDMFKNYKVLSRGGKAWKELKADFEQPS